MVVFERAIGGVVRYLKAFLPSEDQLTELAQSVRGLDVVRVFAAPAVSSKVVPPIARGWAQTTVVDLSKGPEAIYAGMHTNCRYKVRRAEKMHDRFEIVMNTERARADFLSLYNDFAGNKGKLAQLKHHRFDEYLHKTDAFLLYFEGQPTCGRLVLRDEESRTALMLYSGTRRLDKSVDTITVGLLNRYLHWYEMKTYQSSGMAAYDFGGIGSETGSVNTFKLSFGGQLRPVNSYLFAGTARPVWKLAYSLYTRWTGESVLYTRAAAEFSETVTHSPDTRAGNKLLEHSTVQD